MDFSAHFYAHILAFFGRGNIFVVVLHRIDCLLKIGMSAFKMDFRADVDAFVEFYYRHADITVIMSYLADWLLII